MHTTLIFVISLIALLWSANHLVTGACGLISRYNIPPLIIGISILAIGTTLPELIPTILSALNNNNELVLDNAIGSNIANIGLVLGITILIRPHTLSNNNLRKAYPILMIAMLFVYSLTLDGNLSKTDGCLLLIACIGTIGLTIYLSQSYCVTNPIAQQFKSALLAQMTLKSAITSTILGLVVLPISTKYVVSSATEMASWLGMSALTIGLTIQAIGTTLPELGTALIAAIKNEEELAIGTILGSNIYNLLLLIAFPALINPTKINAMSLWRDMPIMLILTLLLLFLNYSYKKNLSRWHGSVLLLIYGCYIASLAIKAG
jgi:cation:H+ antiporter